MNDNQIEVLSKAIDSLLEIRQRIGLIGHQPMTDDQRVYRRAVVNVTNACYLVACLERGEEWQP